MKLFGLFLYLISFYIISCTNKKFDPALKKGTYGYDLNFLRKYRNGLVELKNNEGGRILLSAEDQGRVFTSSSEGDSGKSFGWINYDLIASGKRKKQFNAVGGEERIWLGPEGGQYSIYFKKGDSFTIGNWQVPAIIDTESFELKHLNETYVEFEKQASIINYSGFKFSIGINRKIFLLNKKNIKNEFGSLIPDNIDLIAYKTVNSLKNNGSNTWNKETGLLSIWLLSMMKPTNNTKVFVPFHEFENSGTQYITDDYFGKIPANRLMIKNNILFLRCDGRSRGKIGISPKIAGRLVGSFDYINNVLTILKPEVVEDGDYVNSKWVIQKQPYKGDVINAYNDGPLKDGSQLGPFYEIESSSSVRSLKPGDQFQYHQLICHFHGKYSNLKELTKKLFEVDLDSLKNW